MPTMSIAMAMPLSITLSIAARRMPFVRMLRGHARIVPFDASTLDRSTFERSRRVRPRALPSRYVADEGNA